LGTGLGFCWSLPELRIRRIFGGRSVTTKRIYSSMFAKRRQSIFSGERLITLGKDKSLAPQHLHQLVECDRIGLLTLTIRASDSPSPSPSPFGMITSSSACAQLLVVVIFFETVNLSFLQADTRIQRPLLAVWLRRRRNHFAIHGYHTSIGRR
jgi:hypothetical protein